MKTIVLVIIGLVLFQSSLSYPQFDDLFDDLPFDDIDIDDPIEDEDEIDSNPAWPEPEPVSKNY